MEALLLLLTPTVPTFFLMFLLVYLFAFFLVFRNWDPKHRREASSCFLSLSHGSPAVIMAVHALTRAASTPRSFASPNAAFQNVVLEFSTAYFLMDLLHYMVFFPNDILFISHHLATLYVFATCRFVVHHGAFAILVLLVLAEVTSPCQNVRSIASLRRADAPAAAKLYEFLSLPFYAFYSVVRGILGTLAVYKMGVFYASGAAGNMIPIWAWVSWMVVIVAAILVSILWVLNLWIDWFKERSRRAQKKVK
jgi:hypothetical protein